MDNNLLTPTENLPIPTNTENQISIWDLPEFPYNTKKYEFTPKQLKELFLSWGTSSEWLPRLASEFNIRYQTIWELVETYPEVKTLYDEMDKRKLRHGLGEADHRLLTCKTTIITEKGIQTNTAAVRKEEALATYRLKRAQLRLAEYAPRTITDVRSVSVNFNVNSQATDIDKRNLNQWLGTGDNSP